jgi:hypothetical protein
MTLKRCACRAALEMYELELGYMVVAHSARDPGEFMAQLQAWARLPAGPLRRRARARTPCLHQSLPAVLHHALYVGRNVTCSPVPPLACLVHCTMHFMTAGAQGLSRGLGI